MLRKMLLAIAVLFAVGAAMPTDASARWHGGWHGGGWHGGWHRGWGWRRPGWGWGFYAAPAYYGYYGGCWQVRRVVTPWGWRWRRVWVCG